MIHPKALALLVLLAVFAFDVLPATAEIFEKELAVDETVIIGAKQLPKGWAVASDPELVKFEKSWWMFFNSVKLDFDKGMTIHVLSVSLPPGEPRMRVQVRVQ